MNSKRLFTGIHITPENTLLTYYRALRQELHQEKIKWVEPENLHITLWFFGDTPVKDIPSISRQLKLATSGISPFSLTLKGFGYFGRKNQPTVLWTGLVIPDEMQRLFLQIKNAMQEIGIQGEEREFAPHLTLARIKEIREPANFRSVVRTMEKMEFQSSLINSLVLYESQLRPQGPLYLTLETFNLVQP